MLHADDSVGETLPVFDLLVEQSRTVLRVSSASTLIHALSYSNDELTAGVSALEGAVRMGDLGERKRTGNHGPERTLVREPCEQREIRGTRLDDDEPGPLFHERCSEMR